MGNALSGKDLFGLLSWMNWKATCWSVEIAMAVAGGTLKDIVNLRIYVVKNNSDKAAIIGEVLRKYFGTENPATDTWISVDGLASEDFLIEAEAQVVI